MFRGIDGFPLLARTKRPENGGYILRIIIIVVVDMMYIVESRNRKNGGSCTAEMASGVFVRVKESARFA
jgi:hypothetical protein